MGYLDNSSITVDAILTKKGRELLAKGRTNFKITQFALADDEVDYDLWNPAHPLGSDYYGVVIESMPVTEAVPDETQSMKYKLITLPKGTTAIPYVVLNTSQLDLTTGDTDSSSPNVVPETRYNGNNTINQANLNSVLGYTATLLDSTYLTVRATVTVSGQTSPMNGGSQGDAETANSMTVVGKTFRVFPNSSGKIVGSVKSTKLIVTANETGGRVVIPVVLTPVTRP